MTTGSAHVHSVITSRTIIVGAGPAGICAAARLRMAGDRDFIVLEREDGPGGTWLTSRYPGCRCDVPARLYAYSFAPKRDWPSNYATTDEILRYLEDTVQRFEIPHHLRLDHCLLEATWADDSTWRLVTNRGNLSCRYLVLATGALSHPFHPRIDGLERFDGRIMHSANWDTAQGLDAERVAVIGTGASAVQLIPAIQPKVSRLKVFQRSPGWVLPHAPKVIPAWKRRVLARAPLLQRLLRLSTYLVRELTLVPAFTKYDGLRAALERKALRHLREQIEDDGLRSKLTPDYKLGCKRTLLSSDFYAALSAANTELVTEPIARITPEGIATSDGAVHTADTIVFATGYQVHDHPIGRIVKGRSAHRLAEALDGALPHFLGTTFPYFPNLFLLGGPNTGTGHTSQLFMIESQVSYVVDALEVLGSEELVVEVLLESATAFTEELAAKGRRSVWESGCTSWYQNAQGRNVAIWPGYTFTFKRRTKRFDPTEYLISDAGSGNGP
ncbi:MAG: flavin-containing monooxygenase [Acidimicrobiales bacterium]